MNFELNDASRIKSALFGIVIMNCFMLLTIALDGPVQSIFRTIILYTVFGGLNAVIVAIWAFNYRNDEPSTQMIVAIFLISPVAILVSLFIARLASGGRISHRNVPNFIPELFFPFSYVTNLFLCYYWFKDEE